MVSTYKLYINGKWVKSSSEKTAESINPATVQSLGRYQKGTNEDTRAGIDAAEDSFEKWSNMPPPSRARVLFKAAELLRKNKTRLGKLVTLEMGKVLSEGLGDVQESIDIFEYMAGEGRRLFGHTTTSELHDKFAMTIKRPFGVCGLITPWNFPTAIPAWKLAPALICGNTVVLKPSSDTPICAIEIVKILEKAGVPPGVVNLVTGSASIVGHEIINSNRVSALSFTGSKEAGEWIMHHAGIKKVGMELGGKNPIIVMDDADLDLALDGVVWGAFGTTGQRCTAASRLILHKDIKNQFLKILVKRTKKLRLGNGLKRSTDVGPLVNMGAVKKIRHYVNVGKEEGAELLCGGTSPTGKGFFFRPTIFSEVTSDMRIAREEIFGPVLSVLECEDLDEGIEIANDSEYGLSSSIYTNNVSDAFKAVEKLEAGLSYVNSSTIGSEVHLPFGGVKGTGFTREAGIEGLEEFSYTKTIYVDYSGKLQKAQIDVD